MAPPARTREVFDVLKECAEYMYTESYGEIANRVGLAPSGIGYQLGWIRDNICRRHGLPWINLLAVNKEEWFPGESSRFCPKGSQGGPRATTELCGVGWSSMFSLTTGATYNSTRLRLEPTDSDPSPGPSNEALHRTGSAGR